MAKIFPNYVLTVELTHKRLGGFSYTREGRISLKDDTDLRPLLTEIQMKIAEYVESHSNGKQLDIKAVQK